MKKTISLFPTQVSLSKIRITPRMLAQIERDLKDLQKRDSLGKEWSKEKYYAGYTSYGSASDLPHRYPSFSELKDKIDVEKNRYVKNLQWQADPATIEMSSCWINVMNKGSHHGLHLHPLSVISGTLFLKTPPGCGNFKIQDPRMPSFMARPLVKSESRHQPVEEIKPSPGLLILFESWVHHEVPANQSSLERVSLSFNYNWNP